MTEKERIELVKNGKLKLNSLDSDEISYEVCKAAVEYKGTAIKDVPKSLLTKELCQIAVVNTVMAYRSIPKDYISPDFVVEVARKSDYENINYIPTVYKDKSFYLGLVSTDPEFIWYIPRKALTAEIGKAAIKSMGYSSTSDAVKDYPRLLSRLHKSLYDHETCLNFVESTFFTDRHSFFKENERPWLDEKKGLFGFKDNLVDGYYLSEMMKWVDVIIPLLRLRGDFISFVQKQLLTDDMIKIAIDSTAWAIKKVPEEYRTENVMLYAVEKDPLNIEYMHENMISAEMSKKVVERSGVALRFIPSRFITKELCLIAVKNGDNSVIDYVPRTIMDKDIVLAFLDSNKPRQKILQRVPQEICDYEVCMSAVNNDGNDLKFVPQYLLNTEMCLKAVLSSPWAAEYVPESLFSEEIALATVEGTQLMFDYIPKRYRTEKVCIKAVSQPMTFNYSCLDSIPKEILNQKLCNIAVDKNPLTIEYVPEQFITEDMIISVASSSYSLILINFPIRLRSEEFYKTLINRYPGIESYLSKLSTN